MKNNLVAFILNHIDYALFKYDEKTLIDMKIEDLIEEVMYIELNLID